MNTLNLETVAKHFVRTSIALTQAKNTQQFELIRQDNFKWCTELCKLSKDGINTKEEVNAEIAKQQKLQG